MLVDDASKSLDIAVSNQQPSSMLTMFGSFIKGFGFLGSAFALGYYGFSPSWVFLAVGVWVIRDKMNRDKKMRLAIGRESVYREKEMVLARLDDMPSWVFFPDVERAEWLNKIILKLWPYIGSYTSDLIRTSVEPSIRDNLPSYLKGFKFETINLGNIPLRIGGVKVYSENVARGEIIMDLEIFYSGDCDFVIKVKNLRAGIKDFQLHGTLRIIMKPLVKQIPLVGGLTVFFLRNPDIDFNLTNIADILDMPGLSDTLRNVILEQFAAYMVLPNKLPIPLIADLPSKVLKFTQPAGILQINVVEAKALRKADISLTGKGKSDPFAIITVGAQTFKSQVIDNTVEPYWNYSCEAVIDQLDGQNVDIDIYDEDPGKSNDFLGGTILDVKSVASKGSFESWVTLDSAKTGEVHVKTCWKNLTDDLADLQLTKDKLEAEGSYDLSSALLLVYVDSAKNLPVKPKTCVNPNPKVKLSVGNTVKSTAARYDTQNPVWEECFYFLISDPEIQNLLIEIHENDNDEKIHGTYPFKISSLLESENAEKEQDFHLENSGSESTINATIKLKFFRQTMQSPSVSSSSRSTLNEKECTYSQSQDESSSTPSSGFITMADSENQSSSSENLIKPIEENTMKSLPPSVMNPGLRHRVPSVSQESKHGRIQLTLRYSENRNKFVTVVHKALNLVPDVCDDQPDPYVKLYLLPDNSKESKQKTSACKNTLNPVFDESFDFSVNHSELSKYSLQVSVNSKYSTGVFSKSKTCTLGQVLVPLHDLDLNKASTEWYDLEPFAA